ncbi:MULTISPECIES: accessory gene regulator B family protein [Caproicibacterium]|uniref:Accessory gene regulator B family protein n=1 Tax=Caproicibacterium argilliputei TaxID=3030016 RepID=A0AA97H260_9FIRM|nr:accessory gene regulator B family protein [Caproicibacterium argilliputei]WOC33193.1 accessory gene regulator B family protein [Caproicibacterium argilliputei]
MLHRLSEKCARLLGRAAELDATQTELYCYGFEQILSTAAIAVTIFLMAAAVGHVLYAFLFILCFVPVRVFAGGVHCRTYGGCFLFSNGLFVLSLLLGTMMQKIPSGAAAAVDAVLLLLCSVAVFLLAPVQNENQPLSRQKHLRNKRMARCVILVQAFAIITACLLCAAEQWNLRDCSYAVVSTVLSIALTAAAWCRQRKGGKQNEKSS